MSFTLTLRRHLRQLQRSVVDRPTASTWLQQNTPQTDWLEQLHLTQVVKPSSSTAAKLNNIALAASHINDRECAGVLRYAIMCCCICKNCSPCMKVMMSRYFDGPFPDDEVLPPPLDADSPIAFTVADSAPVTCLM